MKKIGLLLVLQVFLGTFLYAQKGFTLSSDNIGGQLQKEQEFNGFGCDGKNISPQLLWENAPEGTKSFAITMYDPDAPTGSGWWHWLVFDIPANVNELVKNAGSPVSKLMPEGVIQSVTDYGTKGFGGACPPEGHGLHQYIITVYALKVDKLGLTEDTNAAVVGYYLSQNTIGKATIVSYYER